MAYNRDVTGLQSMLDMIEQMKSPQQLQQIAQQYQSQPNGGAIIAAALAQAQRLKRIGAGMQAQQGDQQGEEGQEPDPAEQAIQSIARADLPEDSGIARLNPGNMEFAEGGIVAFAGGGRPPKGDRQPSFDEALDVEGVEDPRERAFLKALYGQESASGADTTTSNRGAVGHMQILPVTFKGVADKDMDINNPFDNMRAGIRYGRQGYNAAGGDPVLAGAHYYGGPGGMEALAAGKARIDPKNPKYPNTREYGQDIAKRMFSMLPMGSAQAAPTAAPAPAAQPPAAPEDDMVYDPMTGVPIHSGTPVEYKESPKEIIKEMARPVVKGVTKAAKAITSAPKTREELEEEAAASRVPFSSGEYRGKSGDPNEDIGPAVLPPMTPQQEKKVLAEAKEAIPASERKGWTDDMLMTFFLSMAAGESPNALTNVAKAGLAALKQGQESKLQEQKARKEAADVSETEAKSSYYKSMARRADLEDKPTAQYLRAVDAELAKLVAPNNMAYQLASPAEKQRMEQEARDRVLRTYSKAYPELASTMMGKTGNPLVDKYLQ